MIKKIFISVGEYLLFMKQVFRKPEKWKIFWRQLMAESDKLIISSILLVGVISVFIGGVLVIQTASNLENPIIDKMYIGYMVRESLVLEFCSTMIASICSVIRILPISEEMFEPILPARISAIIVEQNSSTRLSLTIYPIYILSMIGFSRLDAV